jgi:cell wall assembly regulator SMI1
MMNDFKEEIQKVEQEIVAELKKLAGYRLYRDVIPKPHPPASAQEIRAYEEYLGLTLPNSYRAFLELYNGYDWLAFPGHMLSIQDVMPKGQYYEDIVEWKKELAEFGEGGVLDGIMIAYLDQPNNWVFLDPNRTSTEGELMVVMYVPGVDPEHFDNVIEFLRSSIERAQLAEQWQQNP